ncbi:Lrp/AsnC family transcriptional regulator [Microbacterium hibisci]|uniref:Lrp/AsnC family transcriptional regulator n=1 Tax=Microbacterium hibisci TaxID=2036000 RepID=UPI0019454030|nr:Lrp/AsnC family transcriptional regulator [Microbacterium hibisci]
MDAVDDKILDVLRADGRASFSEVGRRVGLSTNAAAARVRRMEQAGVILGYRVVLAAEVAEDTAGLEAFIDVRLEQAHDSERFLSWSRTVPEIWDAAHVTGPYDYLLHVRVQDTQSLNRLLQTLKAEGGAGQTQTRLALR